MDERGPQITKILRRGNPALEGEEVSTGFSIDSSPPEATIEKLMIHPEGESIGKMDYIQGQPDYSSGNDESNLAVSLWAWHCVPQVILDIKETCPRIQNCLIGWPFGSWSLVGTSKRCIS